MLDFALFEPTLRRALEEDLNGGDITTDACVDAGARAEAMAIAKSAMVVCGGEVFGAVFRMLDPLCEVTTMQRDGQSVNVGTALWRVRGNARALLKAERTALNFAQRMTGTATLTSFYVTSVAPGAVTRITDSRKTTPGLRSLERYAVRMGGGVNHRDNLGSAILIKDNHIVAAGGIRNALERARARAPHTSRIEIEVQTQGELEEALQGGADIVMLDNFDDAKVKAAMARIATCARRPLIEVSGGITKDRVRVLSELGVDVISVGALTHSAPAADISLKLTLSV